MANKKKGKKKDKKKDKKKGKSKKQLRGVKSKKKSGKGNSDKKKQKKKEKLDGAVQSKPDASSGAQPIASAISATTNEEIQLMQAAQSTNNGNYGTNYSIFEWDGSNWNVVEECCDYGCIPAPPVEPGSFVGETACTSCVDQTEGLSLPPDA